MKINKEKIFDEVMKAIDKYQLLYVNDIPACVSCSRSYFLHNIYENEEYKEQIEESIAKQRINAKISIRKKWRDSEQFPQQMAVYKLCSTEEELHALSMSHKKEIEIVSDSVKSIVILPEKDIPKQ